MRGKADMQRYKDQVAIPRCFFSLKTQLKQYRYATALQVTGKCRVRLSSTVDRGPSKQITHRPKKTGFCCTIVVYSSDDGPTLITNCIHPSHRFGRVLSRDFLEGCNSSFCSDQRHVVIHNLIANCSVIGNVVAASYIQALHCTCENKISQ